MAKLACMLEPQASISATILNALRFGILFIQKANVNPPQIAIEINVAIQKNIQKRPDPIMSLLLFDAP